MSRLRCPKCGRFYSDSGIPRDFENWRKAALAIHCEIMLCDALSLSEQIVELDSLSIYTNEVWP